MPSNTKGMKKKKLIHSQVKMGTVLKTLAHISLSSNKIVVYVFFSKINLNEHFFLLLNICSCSFFALIQAQCRWKASLCQLTYTFTFVGFFEIIPLCQVLYISKLCSFLNIIPTLINFFFIIYSYILLSCEISAKQNSQILSLLFFVWRL